jgi:hypothetical protein
MDIVSLSPIPVGGYFWRPRFGGHAYVVIAKATFELTPGTAQLARVHDDLNESDNHWNDDERCSVYAPSDMAPFKERVDVTLVGDAHAPAGARTLTTRLCVGGLDKRVTVQCDRWLDEQGRLREGAPFRRMPIRYERAVQTSENPVGLAVAPPRLSSRRPLPNLQPSGPRPKGRPILAGFGPLAARWPSRARLLGAAKGCFDDTAWREEPLADAVDTRYFNDAPVDQQLDVLAPDARIVLENLHPSLARIESTLPGLEPRAFVQRAGAMTEVALVADTLWIDMTRGLCTVTWRGSFEVASADEVHRVLVALQTAGAALEASDVAGLDRRAVERTSSVRLMQDSEPPLSRSSDAIAAPAVRERAHTLDLAAGAELDAVLPFIARGGDDLLERTSALPVTAFASVIGEAAMPFLDAPRMPVVETPSSPWAAGALSSHRGRLAPPPTPDRESVVPPPLLMVPPPSSSARAHKSVPTGPQRVELLAHDEARYPGVRETWASLRQDDGADEPQNELRAVFGVDDPNEPAAARRHLLCIMKEATPSSMASMRRDLAGGCSEDGDARPPRALCCGTLSFPFDEVETLKATIASVSPYLRKNDALREEVEAARELLKDSALSGSPEVAEELLGRIRATYQEGDEAVDAAAVEARSERLLLGKRAYQRRALLGGRFVRALLSVDGIEVPCYLPEALAAATPLFSRLAVRVIGELHARQDQYETSTIAIRAVALGRIVSPNEEES